MFFLCGFVDRRCRLSPPESRPRSQDFAKARGATYPILAKVDVNGFGAIPLYKFLKDKQGGGLGISAIKWNFTKYVPCASRLPC